jgi:DNA-binding NarL/FixJ family response regulator
VFASLRAGASGFMLKDAPPEEIAAAVQIVATGDAPCAAGAACVPPLNSATRQSQMFAVLAHAR